MFCIVGSTYNDIRALHASVRIRSNVAFSYFPLGLSHAVVPRLASSARLRYCAEILRWQWAPRIPSPNVVSPRILVRPFCLGNMAFRCRFCIAIRPLLCNERSVALFIFFSKPPPVLQPVQLLSPLHFSSSTSYNNVAIMASSLIFAASALLSFSAAAPVHDHLNPGLLEARQAPSCSIGTGLDSRDAYDSSCWDTLNIMPYLTNWKATTPTCTDAENSAGQTMSCCVASEPWSTCFLRLATKQSTAYDCTRVSTDECPLGATSALDPGLDPTIASQVNYVVLNIVTINNFFTSYYIG